jgi:alpha-glucan phosphorylase-like protein
LFTNHTLLAAGNDLFSNDLVALLLSKYSEEIGIPVKTLVDLGLVQQSSMYSMTILAMRSAGKINAVSKLHATKAKEIWTDHPMGSVTNGIHLPTWDKVGDGEMWVTHRENKRKLLEIIAERTGTVWEDNALLLGWARRMASYKRPLALVERLKQFGEMARNTERPVHVVFAGLSHPADTDGQELLEELQYRLVSDLKGVAVYLPHYNLELSSLMTAGCDMWINTPVVGFEACGTSGMKAALNGVLPMSTRDGWVAEVEMFGVGWALPDADLTDQMLDALQTQILPMYYDRNDQGVPEAWLKLMNNARALIKNEFSMSRALKQYLELIGPLR